MSLVLIPDGPGTTIELRDGTQGLPPAPRGTAGIIGRFPSGPVTHAALVLSSAQARLVSGEHDDDFEASLALNDLYQKDTPPVLIGRVTDGNEVQSQSDLWDRDPSRSKSRTNSVINPDRAPLAQAKANNGGRWGGAKRVTVGKLSDITTDLLASTIDISTATETPAAGSFLVDLYAGAELTLEGDTGGPYEVVSNDDQGVLTIKGEFSQAAQDADGTGAIDGQFRVIVPHGKELSVVVGQDSVTKERFSILAMRKFDPDLDWEQVAFYGDLALATGDDRPWVSVIDEGELVNYQIAIDTTYAGETVEEKLPANFCEVPTDVTDATMTVEWYRWSAGSSNTGNAFVGTATPVDTSQIEPHTYDLTYTSATDFDVTVTWPDGSQQSLPAGVEDTLYAPDHPQLASFLVRAGDTASVSGDTIKIRVTPLPSDLADREAFLYPVAVSDDGDTNQRLRIASNSYNTVTVRSDLDLSTFGASAGTPAEITTGDLTGVSLSAAETVIFTVDGGQTVTLTSAGSGPGAAAIAAELDSLDSTDFFQIIDNGDETITFKVNGSYGSKSELEAGAGTGHASLGLPTSGSTFGTDGVAARIEARWPMWGGYDGVDPADARYVLALDVSDNIFKRWLTTNLGLVRLATPGVTSSTVKTSARNLVAKHGWMYIAEFASSIEAAALPSSSAIADMLSNESESDYVEHYFPSRCKYLNKARTKTVTRSNSGEILGLRSFLANVGTDGEKGFHIAAANNNEQGQLTLAVGLSDDLDRWTPEIKLLNDHGIVPILWEGGSVYMFGNRMFSVGRTPQGRRYTITERAVQYHIARDLFVTTRPFIFKSISARRLSEVQVAIRNKMRPYFQDGWFSDVNGPGFEQQVSVLVPPDLNPPEDLLEGKVTASVQFRPRPALEDLKIIISPTQLETQG